jgi:hypothetical protein
MKALRALLLLAGLLMGLGLHTKAAAQSVPKALRGKIVTNSREIVIPTALKGFVQKVRKQDRNAFKRGEDGLWTIYFVAFFNRSLPAEQIGIVVLDEKKEAVAVANVTGQKGQTSLASQIVVESTESVGKKHTLQVYFPRGKKPVVLAKKQIVLKK